MNSSKNSGAWDYRKAYKLMRFSDDQWTGVVYSLQIALGQAHCVSIEREQVHMTIVMYYAYLRSFKFTSNNNMLFKNRYRVEMRVFLSMLLLLFRLVVSAARTSKSPLITSPTNDWWRFHSMLVDLQICLALPQNSTAEINMHSLTRLVTATTTHI